MSKEHLASQTVPVGRGTQAHAIFDAEPSRPEIDFGHIRVGDVVLVRGIVTAVDAEHVAPLEVAFSDNDGVWIDASDVAEHIAVIAVGSRVRNTNCAAYPPAYEGGVVLAIADGWAMVRFDRTPGCVPLAHLARIDGPVRSEATITGNSGMNP